FGGRIPYRPRGDLEPRSSPRAAVAGPKITAPSYYDYKADPLVRVDFAALAAPAQPAAFELSLGPTVRDMAAGLQGFDLLAEKDVAQALVDYYSANPELIWVSGSSANGRAEQAVRLLGSADSYGLNPADYAVTVPPAAYDADDTAGRMAELVRFEMT